MPRLKSNLRESFSAALATPALRRLQLGWLLSSIGGWAFMNDLCDAVLRRVATHVYADGFVITGFHINRELSLQRFDECVTVAGLRVEHRFATWDLRAWHDAADFAVTVLRH